MDLMSSYQDFSLLINQLTFAHCQLQLGAIYNQTIRFMNRLSFIAESIASSPSPSYAKILIEKSTGIATIWLNSPKDLNCLSVAMTTQLKRGLGELDEDSSIKAILIRSKHNKIFCAGADIKHMKEHDYSVYPYSLFFLQMERLFRSLRKPVISVVEGKALGGGFELALLTDIIIATQNASFGLPELTLGLIPTMGGTQLLTKVVGPKVAMKMILSGESINAQEAQRLNLVYLVESEKLQSYLTEYTGLLLNKSTDSLQSAKRAIRFSLETTLDQGLQHQATIFHNLFTKSGAKEGLSAFVEKRKPNFKNL